MTARGWLRLAVCAAATVAIGVGVATLGDVHPDEIVAALHRIGPLAAGIAVVAILAQMSILLTRLWLLFPAPRPRWPRVAHAFAVGEVVNNFVPARAGDVLKVVLIGGPRAQSVGVLVTDVVINVGMLVVLVLAVGPAYLLTLGASTRAAVLACVVVVVVAAVWFARRHSRVAQVIRGMAALRDWRKLAAGLALSVGNWTAEFIALRWLAGEVGGVLGYADALRLLLLLNLGIAFNVSLANVGSFELPIAIGLRPAGVSFSAGLAVGVTYHVLQIATLSLLAAALTIARRRNWFDPEGSRGCGHAGY